MLLLTLKECREEWPQQPGVGVTSGAFLEEESLELGLEGFSRMMRSGEGNGQQLGLVHSRAAESVTEVAEPGVPEPRACVRGCGCVNLCVLCVNA